MIEKRPQDLTGLVAGVEGEIVAEMEKPAIDSKSAVKGGGEAAKRA